MTVYLELGWPGQIFGGIRSVQKGEVMVTRNTVLRMT